MVMRMTLGGDVAARAGRLASTKMESAHELRSPQLPALFECPEVRAWRSLRVPVIRVFTFADAQYDTIALGLFGIGRSNYVTAIRNQK
jgi:hypothetical protein